MQNIQKVALSLSFLALTLVGCSGDRIASPADQVLKPDGLALS